MSETAERGSEGRYANDQTTINYNNNNNIYNQQSHTDNTITVTQLHGAGLA